MSEDAPKKDNTKVEMMLAHMGRSVEELRSSDAWTAMLRVQAKFHRYSASNQLMIWLQNPDATQVAGFQQWKTLKRQVQKGEKGLKIFAPITRKDPDDGDKTKLVGFKMVSVFDVSQTEGEPLPSVEWPKTTTECEGLFDLLAQHIERLGFTVQIVNNDDEGTRGARGWYNRNTQIIHVRDDDLEASMCSTLLHEAGHALDPGLERDIDRGRRELVAESIAYVLGMRYGLDVVDEVTHYLASWKGDVDGLLAIVDRVKVAVTAFDALPQDVEMVA